MTRLWPSASSSLAAASEFNADQKRLLRVLVEDLKSYEEFVRHKLHNIPGIASIDSSFAYGVLKQSNVFPVVT